MHKFLWLAFAFLACNSKPFPDERINKFADSQLVKIAQLQDQRDVNALIPFLKAKKAEHRVQAALAFASIQSDTVIPFLAQMLLIDQDELPRRAAAYALGQIGSPKAAKVLREGFASERSKNNQLYVLEAIGKCIDSTSLAFLTQFDPAETVHKLGWQYGVYRALLKGKTNSAICQRSIYYLEKERNEELRLMAANYLFVYAKRGMDIDSVLITRLFEKEKNQDVKNRLGLIYVNEQKDSLNYNDDWESLFKQAGSPYKAVTLIQLLKVNKDVNRPRLATMVKDTALAAVLRNAAFEKLVIIEEQLSYYPEFFNDLIHYALHSADVGLQSQACYALQKVSFSNLWNTVSIEELKALQAKLRLPGELETFLDFEKAIAFKTGTEPHKPKEDYSHGIDWEFVKTIPRNQQIKIETSKGLIVIQCFVEDAPGSVSNFLKLVDSGYYNNKYFHRVVPSFVIQAGCPRGDGWGSLDWIQRSEFSNYQRYTKGTVGLASAGKDTEGVQWFITHCESPFLTGRYSIFARVVQGMDVVDKIEMGDRIIKIQRMNNSSQ